MCRRRPDHPRGEPRRRRRGASRWRGADGWHYKPFERDDATGEHRITLVREEDGEEVGFTLPPSSSRATSWARSRCW